MSITSVTFDPKIVKTCEEINNEFIGKLRTETSLADVEIMLVRDYCFDPIDMLVNIQLASALRTQTLKLVVKNRHLSGELLARTMDHGEASIRRPGTPLLPLSASSQLISRQIQINRDSINQNIVNIIGLLSEYAGYRRPLLPPKTSPQLNPSSDKDESKRPNKKS